MDIGSESTAERHADASATEGAMDDAVADESVLRAACAGDHAARQHLCRRCLPALQRWARRGLRGIDGGMNDADDLAQIALLRALNRLGEFEVRGAASFLAYLRQILLNEIRAELRKRHRRGDGLEIDEANVGACDPVLDHVLGNERAYAYASALRKLNRRQREHLEWRIDGGMSFGEIAARAGGNADSARMVVARALRAITQHVTAGAA